MTDKKKTPAKKPTAAELEKERKERLQRATCLSEPDAQEAMIEQFLTAMPGYSELEDAEKKQMRSWLIGYLEAEAPLSPLHAEMLIDTVITRHVKLQLVKRASNNKVAKDERMEALKLLPKFQALSLNQMEALQKHFPYQERQKMLNSYGQADDDYDFSHIAELAKKAEEIS
jgi:hypothetical protein